MLSRPAAGCGDRGRVRAFRNPPPLFREYPVASGDGLSRVRVDRPRPSAVPPDRSAPTL